MTRLALAIILAASMATAVPAAAATSAAPPDVSAYALVAARHSDRCLDVSGNSLSNGAKLQQFWCHEGANQRWRLVDSRKTDESGGASIAAASANSVLTC